MTINTAVQRETKKLIIKAKETGIYENFGQTEVRKLKDKFNYLSLIYGSPEQRQQAKGIEDFDNWCMNYCG